jgi:ABC-type amino acid transport substrate-binding protein
MVTRTIGVLALALVAPLAFAQISATSAEQMAASEVVTTYEPGKLIVVASGTGPDTFSYALDKSILYVNKAGKEVDEHLIKPGTRIRICFEAKGQSSVIKRVVVDEESF